MEAKDLLKKVKAIEIKTRQISSQMFSGTYHTKFKGRGMAFTENREYAPGDEIRSINWNVTAKTAVPHVKVFEEEREIRALILVDVSASSFFQSSYSSKKDLTTEVAAVLAISAVQNNDKVGLVLFSDQVEKYVPPGTGKSHVLKIIREMLHSEPTSARTDISEALNFAGRILKKQSILFLISDLESTDFSDSLRRINQKHNLTVIKVADKREDELSDIGLVQLVNPETKELDWVNTSLKAQRKKWFLRKLEKTKKEEELLKKQGVNHTTLYTNTDYSKALINLFSQR